MDILGFVLSLEFAGGVAVGVVFNEAIRRGYRWVANRVRERVT
jgi:hypothetical protein